MEFDKIATVLKVDGIVLLRRMRPLPHPPRQARSLHTTVPTGPISVQTLSPLSLSRVVVGGAGCFAS